MPSKFTGTLDWDCLNRPNERIESIEDGRITFRYKDYARGGVWKSMTLAGPSDPVCIFWLSRLVGNLTWTAYNPRSIPPILAHISGLRRALRFPSAPVLAARAGGRPLRHFRVGVMA